MGTVSSCCGSKDKKYVQEVNKTKGISNQSDPSRQNFEPIQHKELPNQCVLKNSFIKQNGKEILRHYDVQEELGTGSFSLVKKCIDKRTNQPRAIKILQKKYMSLDEVARWVDGVHLVFNLDHPNITKAYEVFEDDDCYYAVLELSTGGDLFGRIVESQNLTEGRAANLMQQILSAVAYLHRSGVAHRDLKPDNILFSNPTEDTIKIIDFGLANDFKRNKKMKGLVGTAYYIAPEVHHSYYNEKCDIWSCGVILYIMLSGYSPYEAGNTGEIFEKVQEGAFSFNDPVWDNITEGAKILISKMLAYDPAKRISAQEALNDPWIHQFSTSEIVSKPIAKEVLKRLQRFRMNSKLQEVLWVFLVSYFSSEQEIHNLRETFRSLDQDKDGQLVQSELKQAFIQVMGMREDFADEESKKVMRRLDHNNDGKIDYTEFLSASISRRTMLTQDKLESAFKMIDKNGDGQITVEELKNLFEEEKILRFPHEVWDDWIRHVSFVENGNINLEEFKQLMLSILQNPGSRSRFASESIY